MSIIKCENGHFYDDEKYDRCPHCSKSRKLVHLIKHSMPNKNIVKCDCGRYYNADTYFECPHCKNGKVYSSHNADVENAAKGISEGAAAINISSEDPDDVKTIPLTSEQAEMYAAFTKDVIDSAACEDEPQIQEEPIHKQEIASRVERCPNGHFYDSFKFSKCPHCESGNIEESKRIEREMESSGEAIGFKTAVKAEAMRRFIDRPHGDKNISEAAITDDDVETVGVVDGAISGNTVAGWIVCVAGSLLGRDFTLHNGRNILSEYPGMSRIDPSTVLAYDNVNKRYILHSGIGETLVNGKTAKVNTQLYDRDRFAICDLEFVFVSFCEG